MTVKIYSVEVIRAESFTDLNNLKNGRNFRRVDGKFTHLHH